MCTELHHENDKTEQARSKALSHVTKSSISFVGKLLSPKALVSRFSKAADALTAFAHKKTEATQEQIAMYNRAATQRPTQHSSFPIRDLYSVGSPYQMAKGEELKAGKKAHGQLAGFFARLNAAVSYTPRIDEAHHTGTINPMRNPDAFKTLQETKRPELK